MGKEVVVKPLTGKNELLDEITVEERDAEISGRLADGKVSLIDAVGKANKEMILNSDRITKALMPDQSKEKAASKEAEPKTTEEKPEEDREVE